MEINLLGLLSDYRILGVPILNSIIIAVYLFLVFHLTLIFDDIHSKVAIFAVMLTNTLLYGLADTLAQTIRNYISFSTSGAPIALGRTQTIIQRGRPREVLLDEYDDDLVELGLGYLAPSKPPPALAHPEIFNFRRLALFSAWGLIISCAQVPWYLFLNSTFNELGTFVSVLQRVLCDQLFYSPISLASFLTYITAVIEGGDRDAVRTKLMCAWLPTLAVNYCVWPAAQFLNFLVIPATFQIPFSSTLSVFWNCYLSLKNPT